MVVMSAMLPVDEQVLGRAINTRVLELNAQMENFRTAITLCRFADVGLEVSDGNGQLRVTVHTGDGIHLTADGYEILVRVLQEVLGRN